MLTLREYLSSGFSFPAHDHFLSLAGANCNPKRAHTAAHAWASMGCIVDPFAMFSPPLGSSSCPKPTIQQVLAAIPHKNCILFYGNPEKCMFRYPAAVVPLFAALKRLPKFRYVVIIGKSQFPFTDYLSRHIPPNVIRVYTLNNVSKSPKVRGYPLGRDHACLRPPPQFAVYKGPGSLKKKQRKIYVEFSDYSNMKHRPACRTGLAGKKFAVFGPRYKQLSEWHKTIAKYRYVACPPGRGFDTFRFWECLFMKCIPVVCAVPTNRYFSDLPFIVVGNWKALTLKYLEVRFNRMLDKRYNFGKLTLSYWQEQVKADYETTTAGGA